MSVASRLAALLVAPVFVVCAVPGPVAITSCTWEEGRLLVRWPAAPGALADHYEVQVASTTDSQPLGILSTGAEEASLDFLLPNSSYHLRLRAHAAGSLSLGPGTWGAVGAAVECRTGAVASGRRPAAVPVAKGPRRTFVMEAMRQSEFTYDVDYLMNHNSGNLLGDAAFLTLSSKGPNTSSFLNVTFRNATFTLFCLEVLSVHVPGTFSTRGDDAFADYLSCNMGNDTADPQCQCDNWIDRVIGGVDPSLHCRTKDGSVCETMEGCQCHCTAASLSNSAKFTGMMPAYPGDHQDVWQWYSHPKATECAEYEAVGARRADGSICTWKRRGDARVLRGWQVLAQGWNITSDFRMKVDPAQVRQNAAAFRKVLSRQPLAPWSCAERGAATQTELVV